MRTRYQIKLSDGQWHALNPEREGDVECLRQMFYEVREVRQHAEPDNPKPCEGGGAIVWPIIFGILTLAAVLAWCGWKAR